MLAKKREHALFASANPQEATILIYIPVCVDAFPLEGLIKRDAMPVSLSFGYHSITIKKQRPKRHHRTPIHKSSGAVDGA